MKMIKTMRSSAAFPLLAVIFLVLSLALVGVPSSAQDGGEGTSPAASVTSDDTEPDDSPNSDVPIDSGKIDAGNDASAPAQAEQSELQLDETLQGELGSPNELASPMFMPEMMLASPLAISTPYSWSPSVVPADNPAMPEKCGLNVAIVMDLSASIGSGRLPMVKEAATNLVTSFYDKNASTLGLFTFAGTTPAAGNINHVPSIDLQSPGGLEQATTIINNYALANANAQTNWQAAFQDVAASGQKYDVVYFITDGMPTVSRGTNPDGTTYVGSRGGQDGAFTTTTEVEKSITAANVLKEQGTRIEGIYIEIKDAAGNPAADLRFVNDQFIDYKTGSWSNPKAVLPNTYGYMYKIDIERLYPELLQAGVVIMRHPTTGSTTQYVWRAIDDPNAYDTGRDIYDGEFYLRDPALGDTPENRVYDPAKLPKYGNEVTGTSAFWTSVEPVPGRAGYYRNVIDVYNIPNDESQVFTREILSYIVGDSAMHTDFNSVAEDVKKLEFPSCRAELIVEKQIVDHEGNVIVTHSVDASGNIVKATTKDAAGKDVEVPHTVEGWKFTVSDVTSKETEKPISLIDDSAIPRVRIASDSEETALVKDDKADGTVAVSGESVFKFESETKETRGTALVTETQQNGYTLRQQNGDNAVCAYLPHPENKAPLGKVSVANGEGDSFTVDGIETGQTVKCVVQNQVPSFKVSKKAADDQDTTKDGVQPKATVQFDGSFTARYEIKVKNNANTVAKLTVPVKDLVTYPQGFTVDSVKFLLGETGIEGVTQNADRAWEIPGDKLGDFAANEEKTITVEVIGKADEAVRKELVENTYKGYCADGSPEDPSRPRSLFNAVSLEGEDDPEGENNNYACVDPEHPGITVEKTVASTPIAMKDGQRFVTYDLKVTNPIDGIDREYSLIDTPNFAEGVTVKKVIVKKGEVGSNDMNAEVDVTNFEGSYPVTSSLKIDPGEATIAPGETHTYTIEVYFDGPIAGTEKTNAWECAVEGVEGGKGLLNSVKLNSGVVEDRDEACTPVPDPLTVTLEIEKFGQDTGIQSLAGAEFAIHAVVKDSANTTIGAVVENAKISVGGGKHTVTGLAPGVEYFLVETKSPVDYQLLPTAVRFKINLVEDGKQVLEVTNYNEVIGVTVPGAPDEDNPNVGPVITEGAVKMQIADVKIGKLPKTGGIGVGVYGLVGAAIIALGALATRRRA